MSITNAARRFEQRFDAKAERFMFQPIRMKTERH